MIPEGMSDYLEQAIITRSLIQSERWCFFVECWSLPLVSRATWLAWHALIIFRRIDSEFAFHEIVRVPDTKAPNTTCLQAVKDLLFVGVGGYGSDILNENSVIATDFQSWRKIENTDKFIGCYCMKLALGGIVAGMYSPDEYSAVLFIDGNSARLIGCVEPGGNVQYQYPDLKTIVESISSYKDQLIVSLSRHMSLRSPGEINNNVATSVWIYKTNTWKPAFQPTIFPEILHAMNFNATKIFREKLLFGSGSCLIGDKTSSFVRLWMLDLNSVEGGNGRPVPIGGGPMAGGWSDEEIWSMNNKGAAWIYTIEEFKDHIYACMSFGLSGGVSSLWRGIPLDR
jgi:hypothetical protein